MTKKKETASTKQDKKQDKKVTLVKMPSYSTMLFGAMPIEQRRPNDSRIRALSK